VRGLVPPSGVLARLLLTLLLDRGDPGDMLDGILDLRRPLDAVRVREWESRLDNDKRGSMRDVDEVLEVRDIELRDVGGLFPGRGGGSRPFLFLRFAAFFVFSSSFLALFAFASLWT